MLFAIFLFLADINCVDNGNGTWTCSGNSQSYPNVTTNAQGQAICTNCVNMTPEYCQSLKQDLITQTANAFLTQDQARSRAYDIVWKLDEKIGQYQNFTDCPYIFNYAAGTPYDPDGIVILILNDSSLNATTATKRSAGTQIANQFNTSPQVVAYNILSPVTIPSSWVNSLFVAFCWNIASSWHSSYLVSQDALAFLTQIRASASQLITDIENIGVNLNSVDSAARAITCDPCQMASGDGSSSGGSGVDQGCRECYLVFLRRFQQQLDQIIDLLTNIDTTTTRILSTVSQGFSTLHADLAGIGYYAERIDDYLLGDQKGYIIQIQAGVEAISNQVYTLQKHFYHTFSNASDITDSVYNDARRLDFQDAFLEIFRDQQNGGFDLRKYEQYDWFKRIELQLAQISGIFSNSNGVDSLSDSSYDDMKNSVDDFDDLSSAADSAGASVTSVGESVRTAIQSIANIFSPASPPQEIKLLDKQYWFADTDLVLRTDWQVVSFCRALFGLIWTVLAVVGFWLLLSRAWVVFFDISKWFCNWFPKIYGN